MTTKKKEDACTILKLVVLLLRLVKLELERSVLMLELFGLCAGLLFVCNLTTRKHSV